MIKKIYHSLFPLKLRNKIHRFKQQVYGDLLLKGDNVKCNCCGKSCSKFLDKGNGIVKRPNAECPNCGSLERTRLLKFYLENETDILKKEMKILHIAPMPCMQKWLMKIQGSSYIHGDLHAEYSEHKIDITDLKFQDRFFDMIICSHVLGHVPDQEKALSEMHRTLKEGGEILLLTLLNQKNKDTVESENELTSAEKLHLYGEHDLVRLHGEETLTQNCIEAGFGVEIIDYRQNFSEKEQKYYALGNGERELIFRLTRANV